MANQQQENTKADARITGQSLSALTDRDAPIDEEQPDAVAKCQTVEVMPIM